MVWYSSFFMLMASCLLTTVNAQPTRSPTLDNVMTQYYFADRAPGGVLLVKKGDEVVFNGGYGLANLESGKPNDAGTHFRMASVSKQFTAKCVYVLIESGALSPDAQLGEFFDQLPAVARVITVGQLLNHTSGIWDYEDLIPRSQKTQVQDADVLDLIRQKDQTYFVPGARFKYSNTGYCLLSLIVEQVSGLPYADFAKQYLFDPPGLAQALVYDAHSEIPDRAYGYHPTGDSFVFADQSVTSATKGDGGVYLSAQEYVRWSAEFMDDSYSSSAYWNMLDAAKVPVKDGIAYSLGWFMGTEIDGTPGLFHSGESTGFRHIVYLNPDKRLTVALFTNRDDMLIADVFDQVAGIMDICLQADDGSRISLFKWLNRVYQ